MKKKYVNFLLLIAVAVIWIVIILRIVDGFEDKNFTTTQFSSVQVEKKNEDIKINVFNQSLSFHNERPFAVNKYQQVRQEKKEYILSQVPNVKKPEVDKRSFFKYYGLVKNPQSKELLGLLQFREEIFQVKTGQPINDSIKVHKLTSLSAIVSVHSQRIEISRE